MLELNCGCNGCQVLLGLTVVRQVGGCNCCDVLPELIFCGQGVGCNDCDDLRGLTM